MFEYFLITTASFIGFSLFIFLLYKFGIISITFSAIPLLSAIYFDEQKLNYPEYSNAFLLFSDSLLTLSSSILAFSFFVLISGLGKGKYEETFIDWLSAYKPIILLFGVVSFAFFFSQFFEKERLDFSHLGYLIFVSLLFLQERITKSQKTK